MVLANARHNAKRDESRGRVANSRAFETLRCAEATETIQRKPCSDLCKPAHRLHWATSAGLESVVKRGLTCWRPGRLRAGPRPPSSATSLRCCLRCGAHRLVRSDAGGCLTGGLQSSGSADATKASSQSKDCCEASDEACCSPGSPSRGSQSSSTVWKQGRWCDRRPFCLEWSGSGPARPSVDPVGNEAGDRQRNGWRIMRMSVPLAGRCPCTKYGGTGRRLLSG